MHRHPLGQYPQEVWRHVHYPFGRYGQEGELRWVPGGQQFWFGVFVGIAFSFLGLNRMLARGLKAEAGIGRARRLPTGGTSQRSSS